jgi:nitroreductase
MKYEFLPVSYPKPTAETQASEAEAFRARLAERRSIRDFSPESVPLSIIETAIATAAHAPSGANQQPWHFVVVSDPETKRQIRLAAEAEERENYGHRFPDEWLQTLAPLGTDWQKPFLEIAPHLIVVFKIDYGIAPPDADQPERRIKHYYVNESVGIAVGFLLAALHWAGLATLTHTPNPMQFLTEILHRPKNEKPYLLIPVGFPSDGARVPNITKKSLTDVMTVVAPKNQGDDASST